MTNLVTHTEEHQYVTFQQHADEALALASYHGEPTPPPTTEQTRRHRIAATLRPYAQAAALTGLAALTILATWITLTLIAAIPV